MMLISNLPIGVRVGMFSTTASDIQQNRKFGHNDDVDTGSVPEDLWNGGGLYTGHNATAAEIVQVFSSDVADASAGVGARTVKIFGLDANYLPISETVTLNGTTAVDSTLSYLRLDRGIVLTAGSTAYNVGILTARQKVTTANIFIKMPIRENQTHIGAFTVPAGFTAFVVHFAVTIAKAGTGGSAFDRSAEVDMYARTLGGVYNSKLHMSVTSGFNVEFPLTVPTILTQKTDVVFRCDEVSVSDSAISASAQYFLIDNKYIGSSVSA